MSRPGFAGPRSKLEKFAELNNYGENNYTNGMHRV